MRLVVAKRLGLTLFVISLIIGVVIAPDITFSATGCPPNTRPATINDLSAMRAAGIPDPVVGMCWDLENPYGGAAPGQVKLYLASLLHGGSCGPYNSSVEQVDPQFAICAARFLRDARTRDPNIHITSAYRSASHQDYLCSGGCGPSNGPCASPGRSKHQYGLALDISNGWRVLPRWIQAMGEGYGVHFPVRNDSGHMEPIPGSNCADPNFVPTDTVGNLTPTSQVAELLRQMLSTQTKPVGVPGQASVSGSETTSVSERQAASQQSVQRLPSGTSVPIVQSVTPLIPQGPVVPVRVVAPTSTEGIYEPSAFERIRAIANQGTGTSSKTSIPVVLVIDGNNVATIGGGTFPQTYYLPQTGTYQLTPSGQQVFVSGDLSQNFVSSYTPQEYSAYQHVLAGMQSTVLYMIDYLKPFGRPSYGVIE